MIGAYRGTKPFARPGWRLTIPGGPVGGHYKGYTHSESRGTDIPPNDAYEQDREDGMSSHDAVHASPRNPRGVYRSSAEVPPRPNASGSAATFRSHQTQRHAGTSVAPGSFPADYFDTSEDAFLDDGLGLGAIAMPVSELVRRGIFTDGGPIFPGPMPVYHRPNTVPCQPPPGYQPVNEIWDPVACKWVAYGDVNPPTQHLPPSSGATSVVTQPAATPLPTPPAQSVPVYVAPPVSPTPAPIVATNQVVPMSDGSGNYFNLSTGQIVPASAVAQNLATMQLTAPGSAAGPASSALSWLEQPSSLFPSIPNWGLIAGGLLLGSMMFKGKR